MRVVIADDSALLREGLARLLVESGVEVCATVADAGRRSPTRRAAPPRRRHRRHPDAADLHPRGRRRRCRAPRASHPDLGVLLLSQAIETHFAAQLLERHAEHFGYLLKDRVVDVAMLIEALETIAGGGTVLDPDIVRQPDAARARRSPLAALTDRERDVLALMAEGRSNSASPTGWSSQPEDGREPHRQHLRQARPARSPGRPPPGAGRAGGLAWWR